MRAVTFLLLPSLPSGSWFKHAGMKGEARFHSHDYSGVEQISFVKRQKRTAPRQESQIVRSQDALYVPSQVPRPSELGNLTTRPSIPVALCLLH